MYCSYCVTSAPVCFLEYLLSEKRSGRDVWRGGKAHSLMFADSYTQARSDTGTISRQLGMAERTATFILPVSPAVDSILVLLVLTYFSMRDSTSQGTWNSPFWLHCLASDSPGVTSVCHLKGWGYRCTPLFLAFTWVPGTWSLCSKHLTHCTRLKSFNTE